MNQTNVKNYYLIGIIGICVTRASSSVNMCIKLTQFRPDNSSLTLKWPGCDCRQSEQLMSTRLLEASE